MIPAAGHSRRMGRPKLLLPAGGRTIIGRLLSVLDHPAIAVRLTVVRADDQSLRAEVERSGGTVVTPPAPPPDMRSSAAAALAEIRRTQAPQDRDGWMLVPGDHPELSAAVIDRLVAAWSSRRDGQLIVVPTHQGRRGHPTIFAWVLASAVDELPPEAGLNALVARHAAHVLEVPVDDSAVTNDLDTPDDYQRLKRSETIE